MREAAGESLESVFPSFLQRPVPRASFVGSECQNTSRSRSVEFEPGCSEDIRAL